MRTLTQEFRSWPVGSGHPPMQRLVKQMWRGERVRYYQRVAGRWTRIRDHLEAARLWEQPGAIPAYTEFDLPAPGRSLRVR